jgi:hypothetical protein
MVKDDHQSLIILRVPRRKGRRTVDSSLLPYRVMGCDTVFIPSFAATLHDLVFMT